MSKLHVVLIGAGYFARTTIEPTLRLVDNTPEITAVCELDKARAENVMERFGVKKYYSDYMEMIDIEKPDAVFVIGGPKVHYSVLKDIIPQKIPIYVEKPIAPTAAQAKELADLAKRYETHVQVGFMHRFAPVTKWARQITQTEEFGKLRMIYAKDIIWGTDYDMVVMDSGIHSLDLIRMFAGDAESVSALSVSDGDQRHGFLSTIKFRNGCICMLNINSYNNFVNPGDDVELFGDGGEWIRYSNWDEGIWYRHYPQYMGPPENPYDSNGYFRQSWTAACENRSLVAQGYIGEIDAFLHSVESGKEPSPNLVDGWRAIELVEAVCTAARTGTTVKIED